MGKREDYIDWNTYYMGIVALSAMRSKDPSTQVGACIVDKDNRIVSIGYNGFPNGCSDDEFSWEREGDLIETKYLFVVHAEQNAIMNSKSSLKDCIMYVNLFPCNECAKNIIQSGIKKVYYMCDKYADTDSVKASKMIFDKAGIEYIMIKLPVDQITIKF